MQIADILRKVKSMDIPEGVVAIYLFGSSVNGKMRDESDIDIAFLPSFKTTLDERLILISKVEGTVAKLLSEKGIRREISVVDLRGKFIALTLQRKIIAEGILLYEKDIMERVEFENTIKREYYDFAPYLNLLRARKYGHLHSKVRSY
jgi:predicted nucleotidyltransferase